MKLSADLKDFDDPLFPANRRIDRKNFKNEARSPSPESPGPKRSKVWVVVVAVAAVAVLGGLTYFLIQAQNQIEALDTNLGQSQAQLSQVSKDLQSSQGQIGELKQGLDQSQSQITNQKQQLNHYRTLYQDLKTGQEAQGESIQTISTQKADQTEVDNLKGETQDIKQQVTRAHANIADLRQATDSNHQEIEATRGDLSKVREGSEANTKNIADIKHSLDREVYHFELQEKGTIFKVFDVAIALKDVDSKRQRYDMEIIVNGRRMKKKDQYVNTPVSFYVDGADKPYELVITKIEGKQVAGYLSVPKA